MWALQGGREGVLSARRAAQRVPPRGGDSHALLRCCGVEWQWRAIHPRSTCSRSVTQSVSQWDRQRDQKIALLALAAAQPPSLSFSVSQSVRVGVSSSPRECVLTA